MNILEVYGLAYNGVEFSADHIKSTDEFTCLHFTEIMRSQPPVLMVGRTTCLAYAISKWPIQGKWTFNLLRIVTENGVQFFAEGNLSSPDNPDLLKTSSIEIEYLVSATGRIIAPAEHSILAAKAA